MSKISCHIIQDILPLYVDGIVSEDTKEMVEEHLRECESCRKEAEHMQERIVLPNKKEFYQKEQEMLQKFKRRLINRRVLSAILGAVFVCALLASGYTILMIPKEAIPFDPDKMKVEIVGEDAYLSYQGDDLAGSFFAYPVKVRDGNREKEVARVYLEKNLWSAYIQRFPKRWHWPGIHKILEKRSGKNPQIILQVLPIFHIILLVHCCWHLSPAQVPDI